MQEDHTKCFSLRIAKNNTRIRHSILNKDYTQFDTLQGHTTCYMHRFEVPLRLSSQARYNTRKEANNRRYKHAQSLRTKRDCPSKVDSW